MKEMPEDNQKNRDSEWDSDDWTVLVDAIHNNHCLLMLGPDVAVPERDDNPLSSQLANKMAEWLKDRLSPKEYRKINPDNLPQVSQFFAEKKGSESYPKSRASTFYEEKAGLTSRLHRDLAALPFQSVITSTHDELFLEALRAEGKTPETDHYNFCGDAVDSVKTGTIESPMVYYLCGHIKVPGSLVLSENDLLDFLVNVIKKDPSLPENILSKFSDPKNCFLFLGFGFRNWYLRILMHVLEDNKKNRSFALEQVFPHKLKEFESAVLFFKQPKHNIHIFKRELKSFSKELKQHYFERYPKNKKPVVKPKPLRNRLRVFISHAKENKDVAEQICNRFKETGYNAWFDKKDLLTGDDFDLEIKSAISKLNYFLLINSRELANREEGYVFREINAALDREKSIRKKFKFILPVTIDDSEPLDETHLLHHFHLKDPNDISEIIRAINKDQERRRKR